MGALKVWDGSAWQNVAGQGRPGSNVFVGPSTPPGTPTSGDMWYDTDEVAGLVLPLTLANGGTGGVSAPTARTSLATPFIGNSTTAAGAPTSGTFAKGDQWLDSANVLWVCVTSGTPGTWMRELRTYVDIYVHAGPFSGSYVQSVPFKCDATFMVAMSFYTGTLGQHAYGIRIDGVNMTWWADFYFNQINTHMTVCVPVVVRNLAAGAHTITYPAMRGTPVSDAGDQARWAGTLVEVR